MTSVPVRGITIKDGKVVKKPPRLSVSKRIGQKAKAERQEKAWKARDRKSRSGI